MISKAHDSSAAIKTIAMAVTPQEEQKKLHRQKAIQRDEVGIQMLLIRGMPKRVILLLLYFCVPLNRQATMAGQKTTIPIHCTSLTLRI